MSESRAMAGNVRGSRRLPVMFFLLLAIPALIAGPTLGQDKCDNKLQKGEGSGPFFGFEYALFAYALAEKACGAPVVSMTSKVLQAVESEGCGPDTRIYTGLRDSIRAMEEWDLKALAQDGRTDPEMSQEQVREWARAAVEDFGGCSNLLGFHGQMQSGFSFGR